MAAQSVSLEDLEDAERSLTDTRSVGLAIANAIYASKTTEQVPAAIAQAALMRGFQPQNLTALIVALLSGQGIAGVPGITPEIIAAATDAMKNTQAAGYKIVWFAFLPGSKYSIDHDRSWAHIACGTQPSSPLCCVSFSRIPLNR